MKYAGWNAEHDQTKYDKRWSYEDADINVVIGKTYSEDYSWEVSVTGEDTQPILNGQYTSHREEETLYETFKTKKKAKVFAHALLDAIHAVYSIQHKEPLDDEGTVNSDSHKEYFQKSMHIKKYIEDKRDIRKGYGTGVVIIGPEKSAYNQLAYEEYVRQAISYYMTDHEIEPERSFRYSVVDYDNNFDDYNTVEESRSRAGITKVEPMDESEIPDCPKCGDKIAENPETCSKCKESVEEAEDAVREYERF